MEEEIGDVMISFDFDYYKPDSLYEAVNCYHTLKADNKAPVYYAGGTELISMARADSIRFGSVIDLKGIPECNLLNQDQGSLVLGSCLTLAQVAESGSFALLAETVSRIADHTVQCKITLGGNVAGTIQYREAALPLMVTHSTAVVMTQSGLCSLPFTDVFDGHLRLSEGDFLVQFMIDLGLVNLPYVHVKKTKNEKIDYPLITLCAINNNGSITAAVSGIACAPLLLPMGPINSKEINYQDRIPQIIEEIRPSIIGDLSGSKEYREFVLANILEQMIKNFDEASVRRKGI